MRRREFLHGMTAVATAATLGRVPVPRGRAARRGRRVSRLDTGWRFLRDDPPGAERGDLDDTSWEQVTLPHTARVEALVTGPPGSPEFQWQGVCWYRRRLRTDRAAGRQVLLRFEGAMNVADVWLDGQHLGRHLGGYLPFVLELGRSRAAGTRPGAGGPAGQPGQSDHGPEAAGGPRLQHVSRALSSGVPDREGPSRR